MLRYADKDLMTDAVSANLMKENVDNEGEETFDKQWHEPRGRTPYHAKRRTCVAAKARDSQHCRQDHPESLHDDCTKA